MIKKSFLVFRYHLSYQLIVDILFCRLIQPILLGQLLSYFTLSTEMTLNEALLYASAMVGCIFLSSLFGSHYLKNSFQHGMKLRVACSSLLYRKVMQVSYICIHIFSFCFSIHRRDYGDRVSSTGNTICCGNRIKVKFTWSIRIFIVAQKCKRELYRCAFPCCRSIKHSI